PHEPFCACGRSPRIAIMIPGAGILPFAHILGRGKDMIRSRRIVVIAALIAGPIFSTQAQTALTAAFTYQGELKNAGTPVTGSFVMVFRLFDDPAAGNQVGPTLTFDGLAGHPAPIAVTNGLFTVALDFGATSYTGQQRWLSITVNGTLLSPRQPVTA